MAKKRKTTKRKKSASSSVSSKDLKVLIKSNEKLVDKMDDVIAEMKTFSKEMHKASTGPMEEANKVIKRMDKIFSLFEEAAKHVGEVQGAEERINNLSNKLEMLLEQNKHIAQGLILLEKYVRGRSGPETMTAPKPLSEYSSP